MTTEHFPEDSRPQAEADNRLLDANEQLTLRALRSQEQADESERRYLGQQEANTLLLQKQRQLRSLASELILSEQRQRKHLATELHDYLAQLMVLGGLKLAHVRSRLVAPDPFLISALGEIEASSAGLLPILARSWLSSALRCYMNWVSRPRSTG